MTTIESLALEVPDPEAAGAFYTAAFGLDDRLSLRSAEAPTDGFRSFTLSLVVSGPATVDALVGCALDAGARSLKAVKKSFWGYGGVTQAPDGTIWKVATSSKKDSDPGAGQIEDIVLLLGVADVGASKRFYLERGLAAGRSFANRYVEFETGRVKLALYRHRALAKDAGVAPEGSGSHRIVICSGAGPFTDLDGFVWEGTQAPDGVRAAAAPVLSASPPAR
jgi:predicted lactoylglutathione lyase